MFTRLNKYEAAADVGFKKKGESNLGLHAEKGGGALGPRLNLRCGPKGSGTRHLHPRSAPGMFSPWRWP